MITDQVAGYVTSIEWRDIPPVTVATAKKLLLDGIGCLLVGTRGEPGKLAERAMARMNGGAGCSTIIISGRRVSPRDAAFVNGITLYSVGVNDIHKPSRSHPGGCVIPAILAAGEWLKSAGPDMIAAMVAGYDVMGRLGRAMLPTHHNRGFHPTGTFGTFGAAAAVGRLLRLNKKQMSSALGIAGSQAAGLRAFQTDGSLTMIFHAGRAAQNGIESALLAQEGFTGPHTVLEDAKGFAAATSDDYKLETITSQLGSKFEVDATSFRPYYGCTLTIAASGATAVIMKRNLQRHAEDVSDITVRCHPRIVEGADDVDPQTMLAARLSIQFNIALVIVRGDVLVGDITEHDLWHPYIRQLLPLVKFETDAGMMPYSSVVTVRFKDGAEERAEMISPKGDPQNPMTWEDVEYKFLLMVEPLGNVNGAVRIMELIRTLEKTDSATLVAGINAVAHSSEQLH
jgi:2-methylcitrate dehydratase PrpD